MAPRSAAAAPARPAAGFTTQETVILTVGKRSGVTEPFNRDKIVRGVRRACQGRPVSEDQLAILAQQVEDAIRAGAARGAVARGGPRDPRPATGAGRGRLPEFASVYRGFESLADFEDEIATLRSGRDGGRQAITRTPGASADAAGPERGPARQEQPAAAR